MNQEDKRLPENAVDVEKSIQLLPDGGVLFSVWDAKAKTVEIEIDVYPMEISERYPLVCDENHVWSITLYDIPSGMHMVYWYFDGKEDVCATAPMRMVQGKSRNCLNVQG